MSEVIHAGSTKIVVDPNWLGHRFENELAQSYWMELPNVLQRAALDEIDASNIPSQILRNNERSIVLLEFKRGPLTQPSSTDILVHSEHAIGNYCYEGTRCTWQDSVSGSFLAFKDPDWNPSG